MADLDPDARVTAAQVREIISTALTDAQMHVMINTAHISVEQRLTGKGLSEDVLEAIELWLSAHFVCMREPRKKQVKVDDLSVTYQGETGMGLQATSYGQQALALDPTGTLSSAGGKKAVIRLE